MGKFILQLEQVRDEQQNTILYQVFDKKYVCLSGEILSVFIRWVMDQMKAFEIHDITMLENKYAEYIVRVERLVNEPLPFSSPFPAS